MVIAGGRYLEGTLLDVLLGYRCHNLGRDASSFELIYGVIPSMTPGNSSRWYIVPKKSMIMK